MTKSNKILMTILSLLFFSIFADAGNGRSYQLHVLGRAYMHDCAYFSNVWGDFEVAFSDPTIPPEAKVYLSYGFSGENHGSNSPIVAWVFQNEILMSKNESINAWTATVGQTLQARSSPMTLDAINFVIRVVYSDGRVAFIKGSDSALGYYKAQVATQGCVPTNMPTLSSLKIEVVEKN